MKVGDLVKNTYNHPVFQPIDSIPNIGVVIELPIEDAKYPQILVAVEGKLDLWWPAVTKVINESR